MNVKQCQGRTFHANVNEMNSTNLKSFFVSRNDKKENLVTLDIIPCLKDEILNTSDNFYMIHVIFLTI